MKKHLSLIALLALCAGLLTGCDIFNNPESDTEIPVGVTYYTGANISFYFVDGEGNDLVDIDDDTTYPVVWSRLILDESYLQELSSHVDQYHQDGKDYFVYANGHNWLSFDSGERLNTLGTHLWGVTVEKENKTYVHVAGGVDSMNVTCRYLTAADGVQIQGGGWAVEVESVRYNGVEILAGNENGKVFIQKPSRNETIVRVGRL